MLLLARKAKEGGGTNCSGIRVSLPLSLLLCIQTKPARRKSQNERRRMAASNTPNDRIHPSSAGRRQHLAYSLFRGAQGLHTDLTPLFISCGRHLHSWKHKRLCCLETTTNSPPKSNMPKPRNTSHRRESSSSLTSKTPKTVKQVTLAAPTHVLSS